MNPTFFKKLGWMLMLSSFVIANRVMAQATQDTSQIVQHNKPQGRVIQIKLPSFLIANSDTTPNIQKPGRFECTDQWMNSRFLKENQLGLFQNYGISIYKYDWKDSQMNCHVNLAAKHFQRGIRFKSAGLTMLLAGLSLTPAAIILAAESTPVPLVFTSLLTVSSIPFFVQRSKEKRKMEKHLNGVADYFRTKNL